jgi:hypothetical protein
MTGEPLVLAFVISTETPAAVGTGTGDAGTKRVHGTATGGLRGMTPAERTATNGMSEAWRSRTH